ncbi:MAG: DUF4097 domain-containing protein [Lentisphaeria bacterium]|nr:DUF4097 domain-containing protein [Candidatus Neomarinimicrobiota bacterium]MCF7841628.1 DUF4097 domain-containing protein [Lentisphaeria bacterium]
MKRLILTGLGVIFSTISLVRGAEKVLLDQAFSTGGQLHLMHVVGEVTITGSEADHVKIIEEVSDFSPRSRDAEFSSVEIEGSRIVVSARPGSGTYREIRAEVPAYFSVAVGGAGGDISVKNLTGEVLIHISGGDTELENIRGKVTVQTKAGDVYMRDIQGRVSVTTQGGDLDLRQFQGNVSLENNAGDVSITDGTGNVNIHSGSGDLFVGELSGDSLQVNLRAGDLQLENFQGRGIFVLKYGDVDIEKMAGPLDVELDMGSLAIQRLLGSLDARLKIGDLEVEEHSGSGRIRIDRGDVEYSWEMPSTGGDDSLSINTKLGSVALRLPAQLNPSLFLESSEEAEGLERFRDEMSRQQQGINRYVYRYSGDNGTVKITTKVGKIRIYER